jgi:hypothetical protein
MSVANRLRLPAMYSFGFYAASGGLISYGIDQTELVREAASYASRRVAVSGLGVTMRPPFGSRPNSVKTRQTSAALRTPAADTVLIPFFGERIRPSFRFNCPQGTSLRSTFPIRCSCLPEAKRSVSLISVR